MSDVIFDGPSGPTPPPIPMPVPPAPPSPSPTPMPTPVFDPTKLEAVLGDVLQIAAKVAGLTGHAMLSAELLAVYGVLTNPEFIQLINMVLAVPAHLRGQTITNLKASLPQ